MTNFESLKGIFQEMGVQYKVKSRFRTVNRFKWPYKGETIPGSRIHVDGSCFPMEEGLLDFWKGYSEFYFYFDFDENGKFVRCGAFE